MICHKYKCIFVHQRKAAGSSIISSFGYAAHSPEWTTCNNGVIDTEYDIFDYMNRYPDYHVFCVIRNPWDRFVSGWKYCANTKNLSIENVLENLPSEGHDYRHITRLQYELITSNNGNFITNSILRYESIEKDYITLCEKLNKPYSPLRHINKTPHDYYKIYFKSKKSKNLFFKHFHRDLELFGYSC